MFDSDTCSQQELLLTHWKRVVLRHSLVALLGVASMAVLAFLFWQRSDHQPPKALMAAAGKAMALNSLPFLKPHSGPADLRRCLVAHNVPMADWWVKVAVTETGFHFSHGVGALNNVFGMRCHSRPTQCGCTPHGYAVYASRSHAVRDIALWVRQDPPRPNENGEQFLRRRQWNPFPGYYAYVHSVDPYWNEQTLVSGPSIRASASR